MKKFNLRFASLIILYFAFSAIILFAFTKLANGASSKTPSAFDKAIEYILENEGFESNHPSDDGGYTKYGIAQNFHPGTNVKDITIDSAKDFYFKNYWSNTQIPKIQNDLLRIKFADASVLMGYHRATLLLQRAIRATGRYIEIDGIFGKQTLSMVNQYLDKSILWVFTSEVVSFLEDLAEDDPSKRVFLKGWTSRGYLQPE